MEEAVDVACAKEFAIAFAAAPAVTSASVPLFCC